MQGARTCRAHCVPYSTSVTNDHSSRYIYVYRYIHWQHYTNIWFSMKIHFLLSQIEKKIYENMKKKIIDYLIDYACPIISDNRLWNFSDCTSLLIILMSLLVCRSHCYIMEVHVKWSCAQHIPSILINFSLIKICIQWVKITSYFWYQCNMCNKSYPAYANELHQSVGHDRCKLTWTCERFPICDDKITENDQCVIKLLAYTEM